MSTKRVFIIVLDGFGIGYMPDADKFGDEGSNTLRSISCSKHFDVPNLVAMGLGNIDGVECILSDKNPDGCFARTGMMSAGKDTITGHWELAGLVIKHPFPTYPKGFPREILKKFEKTTGKQTIVNRPISGTEALERYGEKHVNTGALIVYTSGDSVFQIAAHEDVVSLDELHKYCKIARKILSGKHAVARVIARPFTGEHGYYKRTNARKDYSLRPGKKTMLDILSLAGIPTIGIGKIYDIFTGKGISFSYKTNSNYEGMDKIIKIANERSSGLIFTNLVDFDMLYGHRNDIEGYAIALKEFDKELGVLKKVMSKEDLLIITADHGCDPGYPGTDHTREYVPVLVYGKEIKSGVNLKTRNTIGDIAATTLEYFDLQGEITGSSFLKDIR